MSKKLAQKELKYETKKVPVDISQHSFFDDDLGVVVDFDGIHKLFDSMSTELSLGWDYLDVRKDEEDDTLFYLFLCKKKDAKA